MARGAAVNRLSTKKCLSRKALRLDEAHVLRNTCGHILCTSVSAIWRLSVVS